MNRAALCVHLAHCTNGDADQMDCLFRQSGLMRETWERADYRQWTIDYVLLAFRGRHDD